ncbi:WD40 repeat domain-containing protein [Phytomonospora sp. NPDC050363]|uniref:WD40 repeat domain-containing protein n=1 Tax=Phytomonospora sp. NPDC050363 TaxID=3155642 RepID=UPI0033EA4CA3
MTDEDRLRTQLHEAPRPHELILPAGLADTVLRRNTVRRTRHMVLAAALAVVATAAVPAIVLGGEEPAGTHAGADPTPTAPEHVRPSAPAEVPRQGGGPIVVHSYYENLNHTGPARLLDPESGEYREVPHPVIPSPDLETVLVKGQWPARDGVADRDEYLASGEAAVTWLDEIPVDHGDVRWSPDGKALMTFVRAASGPAVTIWRYDLDEGDYEQIAVDLGRTPLDIGWAADSRRYLALPAEGDSLLYIEADGKLGERLDVAQAGVGGAELFSPSRRLLVTTGESGDEQGSWQSLVVDLETGREVLTIPLQGRAVGWYDERTVVWFDVGGDTAPSLRLIDATDGTVGETVLLPWINRISIGSSDGLSGSAKDLGF